MAPLRIFGENPILPFLEQPNFLYLQKVEIICHYMKNEIRQQENSKKNFAINITYFFIFC